MRKSVSADGSAFAPVPVAQEHMTESKWKKYGNHNADKDRHLEPLGYDTILRSPPIEIGNLTLDGRRASA
jgi:hypothetical protein